MSDVGVFAIGEVQSSVVELFVLGFLEQRIRGVIGSLPHIMAFQ